VFHVGQVVALRSDPARSGAVVRVIESDIERRYQVFLDNRTSTYYESMLMPAVDGDETELLALDEFRARLTALQINQPSLSNLYSLHAARVNFIPYQFRPVLRFIRADRPRLLIADEVGVGKTIEAGLILRELQARREVRSVLIICPKALVTERKWQQEMARFDESFQHLDGPMLRHCIAETNRDGEWPDSHSRVILPFSLLNDERNLMGDEASGRAGEVGLLRLDPPPRFDLVIVDEAHHLRSTDTNLHQAVSYLVENADAAVFLTATPIQLESEDLFVLLNLLRPDVVLDRATFRMMSEPNVSINEAIAVARAGQSGWQDLASASLAAAGATDWGRAVLSRNPEFSRLTAMLTSGLLTSEQRLELIRDAEGLHTFASLINRTRRRDIGEFTTRRAETVSVPFSEPQQELHDALLATQERILRRAHGVRSVRFLMTTLRRQAASCLYGLAPLIESILSRRIGEIELDEADAWDDELGEEVVSTIREDIDNVLQLARSLSGPDPKLERLKAVVREKQLMGNNKLLMFSSFRHTLAYVNHHLGSESVRIGLIHGEVPDEERRELRDRFSLPSENPRAIDILLSSEVGCEGLDYQFCDAIVNLDLPWNPSRIEQRIGRIDRYGQESETVAIYNLVTPGTVDFDIYDRCLLRIGVFQRALGGNEEILGEINEELRSVAESFELTHEERVARLQQIADNNIRLIQEQQHLEEEQSQLFGILLPPEQIEREVEDATSAWLTPNALENLVRSYLRDIGAGDAITGDDLIKSIRLNQDNRHRLLQDFQSLAKRTSPVHRHWQTYLLGGDPKMQVTFDARSATSDRKLAFVTPIHPLAVQASKKQAQRPPFRTALRVRDNSILPGTYPFAIYLWQRNGISEDAVLQTVARDPAVGAAVLRFLASGHCEPLGPECLPTQEVFDELEGSHYAQWNSAREEFREATRQTARFRRESLRLSHEAMIAAFREKHAKVPNPSIRRMLLSQIAKHESGFERRLAEIDSAEARAEILFDQVALGVVIVEAAE
jgi:ATP-dependent helicase HepA